MASNHHAFTIICLAILIGNNLCDSLKLKQKPYDLDVIDIDDENNANLFYADDDELSTEKTPTAKKLTIKQVMLEILRNANISSNDKCQQYKTDINDLCMAKFYQRSRLRYDLTTIDEEVVNDVESIASAQQVCCEFRSTYLHCLISSINFICDPSEFNSLFEQIRGLSEICSKFFDKSSRKCRRRYTIMASGGFSFQNIVPPELNVTKP
uniref:Uncharacterized protein LOC113794344 n=1 Tax=Dermatophagoides pteronyssinus TaxID=6956 RepID=A0A6P6Y451_DERPT|nr:uncharacterized protein LOC113794344 [Dermatophagoides pteronyssinus]